VETVPLKTATTARYKKAPFLGAFLYLLFKGVCVRTYVWIEYLCCDAAPKLSGSDPKGGGRKSK